MTFQRERLSDCRDELVPLIALHGEGFAQYPDIAVNPNWELWFEVERIGVTRFYTVRLDRALGGYAIFSVCLDIVYRTSKQATQMTLYVHPALRRGLMGYRFLKWCDEQLRAEGVQVVHHHVDTKYDFSPLLGRLGYELSASIYSRRLDGETS